MRITAIIRQLLHRWSVSDLSSKPSLVPQPVSAVYPSYKTALRAKGWCLILDYVSPGAVFQKDSLRYDCIKRSRIPLPSTVGFNTARPIFQLPVKGPHWLHRKSRDRASPSAKLKPLEEGPPRSIVDNSPY